ncbi:hypothetical protein P691DRAFT_775276 [Macrolepiota fuliginosa MF-IS2]|uniref:Uncharacterized protein n=1 Tax=Macrolepiota fuliginosa MF-IS2 TaxID=1400762 RepID=A0A9P5XEG8_9AGAR|nr:hypothetical protein P691DRAFT_775276 [Macrolepiota fuliginosa MF-IS2]
MPPPGRVTFEGEERPPGPRNLQQGPTTNNKIIHTNAALVHSDVSSFHEFKARPFTSYISRLAHHHYPDQVHLNTLLRHKSKRPPTVCYNLRVRPLKTTTFLCLLLDESRAARLLLVRNRPSPSSASGTATSLGTSISPLRTAVSLSTTFLIKFTKYDYRTTDILSSQREQIDRSCNYRESLRTRNLSY